MQKLSCPDPTCKGLLGFPIEFDPLDFDLPAKYRCEKCKKIFKREIKVKRYIRFTEVEA